MCILGNYEVKRLEIDTQMFHLKLKLPSSMDSLPELTKYILR